LIEWTHSIVLFDRWVEATGKSILIIYIKPSPDGGLTALQRQQVTAVYLDTRALRIIGDSPELGWHAGLEIESRA
jgi:hypothetical protein